MIERIKVRNHKWHTAVALAVAIIMGSEAEAHAVLPVAVAGSLFEFYEKAFEVFQFVQLIFGDQDLGSQLLTVESAILGEMRTQRNQAWRSTAQGAFDKFRILVARSSDHPDNPALRDEASSLATSAIEQLAVIVDDGTDAESAYQLAPTFNSLVTTQTALTWMLDEIYPGTYAPWAEYHVYLWRGITTDYKLVGARFVQCWPGYDPGTGNYTVSLPSEASQTYKSSQLWTQKIANRTVGVNFPTMTVCGCARVCADCRSVNSDICNPGKKTCDPIMGGGCSVCATGGSGINYFPATPANLLLSERVIDPIWSADTVVTTTKAAMNSILSVGGGEDPASDDDVSLVYMGMLVDPWVDEPVQCANNPAGPWAYPTFP